MKFIFNRVFIRILIISVFGTYALYLVLNQIQSINQPLYNNSVSLFSIVLIIIFISIFNILAIRQALLFRSKLLSKIQELESKLKQLEQEKREIIKTSPKKQESFHRSKALREWMKWE